MTNKTIIKLFAVLLLTFAQFSLTSCGKDDVINQELEIEIPETPPQEEGFNLKRDIIGRWRVLESNDKTVVFNTDATGYIEKSGEREWFTWATGTGTLSNVSILQYFDGEYYPINVVGDKPNTRDRIFFLDGAHGVRYNEKNPSPGSQYTYFTLVRL